MEIIKEKILDLMLPTIPLYVTGLMDEWNCTFNMKLQLYLYLEVVTFLAKLTWYDARMKY